MTVNSPQKILLEAEAGTTIFASTGMLGRNHKDRMSTQHFYRATKGSKIILLDKDYYFNVATYSLDFDDKYIYTYSYQSEQSWTTYNGDLSGETYIQNDYIFYEEVYFRICLKRVDGKDFQEEESQKINDIIMFTSDEIKKQSKNIFIEEIEKNVDSIIQLRKTNSLVLCVLTDSHFTINGTWQDTIHNIEAVNKKINFDGIVHLGDITDGMVPSAITKKYANKCIDDLKNINSQLYFVIGNHDTNYFNNNLQPITEKEQYELYQSHSADYTQREDGKVYYYADFENVSLRCIFLTSFDHKEEVRYGFSEEMLKWIKDVLENTPPWYSIIIFSHDAPLAKLDYWSEYIRNGNELMDILEEYHLYRDKKIMAFIHGHTHADYIYTERAFPIISIGCSKCEYFIDKKPEGSITYERRLNTVSQELWDTLIITPSENKIDFIRFGAGEDRIVNCNYSK